MGLVCLFVVILILFFVEWRQEDGLVYLEGSSIFLFMIDIGVYSMIRFNKVKGEILFYENKRVGFYLFKIFILLGIYYLVQEMFLNELNIKVINFMSINSKGILKKII